MRRVYSEPIAALCHGATVHHHRRGALATRQGRRTDRSRDSRVKTIIATRNILVHTYAIVDDRVVWDTATQHLPALCTKVHRLLTDRSGAATAAQGKGAPDHEQRHVDSPLNKGGREAYSYRVGPQYRMA
jgi:hypothetical protein